MFHITADCRISWRQTEIAGYRNIMLNIADCFKYNDIHDVLGFGSIPVFRCFVPVVRLIDLCFLILVLAVGSEPETF